MLDRMEFQKVEERASKERLKVFVFGTEYRDLRHGISFSVSGLSICTVGVYGCKKGAWS